MGEEGNLINKQISYSVLNKTVIKIKEADINLKSSHLKKGCDNTKNEARLVLFLRHQDRDQETMSSISLKAQTATCGSKATCKLKNTSIYVPQVENWKKVITILAVVKTKYYDLMVT